MTATVLLLCVTADAARDMPSPWWKKRGKICPGNAKLAGAPPPRGSDVACVKRSGAWHGPRTTWFDKCTRAAPCKGRRPRLRFQGEYNRGIEHGHWIFWHKNGDKGLEGDYFAGKKSGTWYAWDKAGNRRAIEYEDYAASEQTADDAILAALEKAKALGNEDLARELDSASADLARTHRATRTNEGSRGTEGGDMETIDAGARVGGNSDVPDVDLGAAEFADGGGGAPAYVRRAIHRATRDVVRCYERIRADHPKLSGEIVSRFQIAADGTVPEARVVKSTMTETMNQCVKRVLRALRFTAHEGAPVEVIAPWRFEAPKRGKR